MGNTFLDSYKGKPQKKDKKGKATSKLVAVRIPMEVYDKLEELRHAKNEKMSKTIIKALKYSLELE